MVVADSTRSGRAIPKLIFPHCRRGPWITGDNGEVASILATMDAPRRSWRSRWLVRTRRPEVVEHPLTRLRPVPPYLLAEFVLLAVWVGAKVATIFLAASGGHSFLFGIASIWVLTAISAGLVVTILLLAHFEIRRLRAGLRDASIALHSMELVTEPGLSFRPLEDLLETLLARTATVVGGELAIIFLLDADGRALSVRATHGVDIAGEDAKVPFGSGIIGTVASQARLRMLTDAADAQAAIPGLRHPVASLIAAPLLQGGRVIGVVAVGSAERQTFGARGKHLLELVAERAAASIERARLDESERRSRLGAEQARRHLDLLARASGVLATALESYDETFVRLVDVVVPSFADWFAVDLVDDRGAVVRVAEGSRGKSARGAHTVFGDPLGMAADLFGHHRHPDGDRLVRRALETGRPEVVLDARRIGTVHPGQLATRGGFTDAAPASGVESMMIIPVHVRGLAFGVLNFATEPGRRGYRRSDLDTALDLAQRVAVTVERVLLWGDTRRAEAVAVRQAEQLRKLVEAALGVNAPLEEPEILRLFAEHACHVLDGDWSVVCRGTKPPTMDLVSPLAALRSSRVDEQVLDEVCTEVLAANHPVHGRVDADRPVSWLGAPLGAGSGAEQRVVIVFSTVVPDFSTEDESVLLLLTQMVSEALENARLYQAVQGNEERLRAVVQSSPLAIAELDLQGDVQWWNRAAAALFGWPEPGTGESEGRGVPVQPGARHELDRLVARARAGEATVGSELRAFGHENNVLELSVSTAPLRDHAGVVRGILAVMEDVTERLAMLEQFHQAERVGAMARLAGAVAHDFNNLLTVILGSSEILLRQVSESAAKDEIAAIQRAGQRAAALTGQLLAIGQRNPVRPLVTDPDTAIENMLPMLARVMRPGVDVEHVSADDPQRILVDPTELERAILNLAINANDAMPEGGTFSIVTNGTSTRRKDAPAGVVVSVSDNGVGMSEEIAAHCFEPFFTTKERGRGTGLGLAAVHAMVTQAGGLVSVASAPGKGTTFTLVFPAAEGDPETEALDADAGHSAGGETVLLVEDEDELRRLAVQALEWRGYRVLEASSGAEALALARGLRRRPHLLVTDVVMPGMSGTELAAELAQRWPAMPILFVSGHLDEESTGPLQEGADLLPKPFTPDQLGKRVRQAIDHAERSARAQRSKAQGSKR